MASLAEVVETVLSHRGLELEKLSQVKAGSRVVLRITVDGDGADRHGLTLDEVSAASQAISRELDESGVMGERPYVLEVGTPGVDRPLTTPTQWRRNVGRLVKVTRHEGDPVLGRIAAVRDEGVDLVGDIALSFDEVAKAIVQVEMKRDEEKEDDPWTLM
ncbi:MAG: ribosome maturation factor RimP [Propionibacteriaceae bacterium]|jgi:ribosome maturation factor RimP|nr:ribosome maturation factor RimP [Propionibacteriaceae bacterium]